MMTNNDMIDLIKKQDHKSCNVCQRILASLENRRRFWLVVSSNGNKAIVSATTITDAILCSGISSVGHVCDAFVLDPEDLALPYESSDYPSVILSKRE